MPRVGGLLRLFQGGRDLQDRIFETFERRVGHGLQRLVDGIGGQLKICRRRHPRNRPGFEQHSHGPKRHHAESVGTDQDIADELGRIIDERGNRRTIVDPQTSFRDMSDFSASQLVQFSSGLRRALNEDHSFAHPEQPEIRGLSHILWTGAPKDPRATARNAVFYGDKAIDRSPCGTGTSARMAQWAATGRLKEGDEFIHESIIGSLFHGRVERMTTIGNLPGIIPSIGGWARMTGYNTIFIDDRDPYAHGFQVI